MKLEELKERLSRYELKIKSSSTEEQKEIYKTLFFNILEEMAHKLKGLEKDRDNLRDKIENILTPEKLREEYKRKYFTILKEIEKIEAENEGKNLHHKK